MIIAILLVVVAFLAGGISYFAYQHYKLAGVVKGMVATIKTFVDARTAYLETMAHTAEANASIGSRLCSECQRVVHKFEVVADSVICHDCLRKRTIR